MIYYTKVPTRVELGSGKVPADISQVRGDYVLLRTESKDYPWGSIFDDESGFTKTTKYQPVGEEKFEEANSDLQLELKWHTKGILPEIQTPTHYDVQVEYQPQIQASIEKELGGSSTTSQSSVGFSSDDLINSISRTPKPEPVAKYLSTRFNLLYRITTGILMSPRTIATIDWHWSDDLALAMRSEAEARAGMLQELTERQLNLVVQMCNQSVKWEDLQRSFNSDGTFQQWPDGLKSHPQLTKSGRYTNLNGRNWTLGDLLQEIT